jgi:hypothetical protein
VVLYERFRLTFVDVGFLNTESPQSNMMYIIKNQAWLDNDADERVRCGGGASGFWSFLGAGLRRHLNSA